MVEKIKKIFYDLNEITEDIEKNIGKGIVYAINFFPDLIKVIEYKHNQNFCYSEDHRGSNGKLCCIHSKNIINKGLVKILCQECSDKKISISGISGLYHSYLLCGKNKEDNSIDSNKI